MANANLTTGFYANDVETFYLAPNGQAFIVYSADDLGTDKPVAIDCIPADATAVPADADLARRAELTEACADYSKNHEAMRGFVIEAAKKDAAAFVAEFGEPLDPSTTDWDSLAWVDVVEKLDASDEEFERLWPIYQAELAAETERLCES